MLATVPVNALDAMLKVGGPAVAIIVSLGAVFYVIGKYIALPMMREWSTGSAVARESAVEAKNAAHQARGAATAAESAAKSSLSAAEASHRIVESLIRKMEA